MDRRQTEPLTTEEAKQQLREASQRIGITPWVRRQPLAAVGVGLVAGYLVGRVPRLWTHLSRSGMGQRMIDRLV